MKISTKGRYALRLMLDLAVHNTGEYIPLKTISNRQEISEKYLEQIITLLSRAGYVKSIRGPQGGYRLAKAPENYTVGMILRLTEGSLAPVACLDDDPIQCNRINECATYEVWKKLYKSITDTVDSVTISDLVKTHHQKAANDYII